MASEEILENSISCLADLQLIAVSCKDAISKLLACYRKIVF